MEPSYFSENPLCNNTLFSYLSQPLEQQHSEWNLEENRIFENALAEFDLDSSDLFEKIATRVPGKSVAQIKKHFEELLEDVKMIESGIFPDPNYITSDSSGNRSAMETKSGQRKRKKGIPWTKEEHELFLQGLEKYGKGDWRSISRMCVVTKNPTQVASHAQKYFLRLQNSVSGQNLESNSRQNQLSISKYALQSSSAPSPYFSESSGAASIADQFYAAYSSSY